MKDWLLWHREQLVAAGVLGLVVLAAGFMIIGELTLTWWWLVPSAACLGAMTYTMNHWSSWFTYLPPEPQLHGVHVEDLVTNDQWQFEKYRDLFGKELDGRTDPEFETIVAEQLARIPDEVKGEIPVRIIDDDILFKSVTKRSDGKLEMFFIWATFEHVHRTVTLYSFPIRLHAKEQDIDINDWVYRLLLHEFGHAQGESDKEMAETHHY